MIQRIQTVYLFLAAVLMTACACLPIGAFVPDGLGAPTEMYNMALVDGDTRTWAFTPIGLFALLAAGVVTTVITIFKFDDRRRQSRGCLVAMMLMLLWIALYVLLTSVLCPEGMHFRYEISGSLPVLCIILLWLARRGILHDERLVRAADRLR